MQESFSRLTLKMILVITFFFTLSFAVKAQGNSHTPADEPAGTILFLSTRDGNFDIYSMDASGNNHVNLTNHPKMDFWISCDQMRGLIYFYSNRNGNTDLYYMNRYGENQKMKDNNKATDTNPQISPDGLTILFQSDRDNKMGELYTMKINTNEAIRITHNEAHEDVAAWSPDGNTIVFSKDSRSSDSDQENQDGDYELFTILPNGSDEKKLTNFPGFVSGPCYSPDGKKIDMYGRGEDGFLDLFVMKSNGKGIVNVTQDTLEQYSPSWSPDGKWIAYTGGDSSNYDVWIIHLKSGKRMRLTNDPKRDENPVWIRGASADK